MESTLPPEGSLDEIGLSALLTDLAERRATGVVRIVDRGELWLDAGSVYLALADSSPDVAEVLYDAELGDPAAIDAALAGPASEDEPGAADRLLAGHPEADDVLRRLLHELNLNALFELLLPTTGRYGFEEGARHPLGSRFAEDTAELLASARQRVEIWRRIATRIPSTASVFVLAPRLPPGLDERVVTADEWRFLALLDGRHSVADIIDATGESAFRVGSTLYRLLLEELITDR